MPASVESPRSTTEAARMAALQIDRILRSNTFRTCEVLRNLLTFLAAKAVDGRADLKSKEIATVVFGRSDQFDSQSDSVVRVQTGRLRSKLAEYYVDEGAEDTVVVSIPKGTYALAWHNRHPAQDHAAGSATLEIPPAEEVQTVAPKARSNRRLVLVAAVTALVTVVAVLGYWAGTIAQQKRASQRQRSALSTFWSVFLDGNEPPLIVFSNLKLVGSLNEGFHVFRNEGADRDQPVFDSWSTVGEVMGVFNIERTLSNLGKSAIAKHGHLLTWDDARDRSLIFVGGPLADTPLKDVSLFRGLQFTNRAPGVPRESGGVVNVHPRRGELALYNGPEARPFAFDYAVISLSPAFSNHHRMLALAGVTEYGTAGAADYLTREDHVAELLAALHVKTGEPIPFFEALLRVKIEGEVPVQYDLVLIHKTSS